LVTSINTIRPVDCSLVGLHEFELTSPEANRLPSVENARTRISPRLSEISVKTFREVPFTVASVTLAPEPKATTSSPEPPKAAAAVTAPGWTEEVPPTG
jgi:hypothetical protein